MSITYYALIVDDSGSMSPFIDKTLSLVDEYVKGACADHTETGEAARLSLLTFDTTVKEICRSVTPDNVPALTKENYGRGGMTALNDAIGKVISDIAPQAGKDDRALIVIIADGQENASKEFTTRAIRDLIVAKERDENYTFVYLGAHADAFAEAAKYGVLCGNSLMFSGSNTEAIGSALNQTRSVYTKSFTSKSSSFVSSAGDDFKKAGGETAG